MGNYKSLVTHKIEMSALQNKTYIRTMANPPSYTLHYTLHNIIDCSVLGYQHFNFKYNIFHSYLGFTMYRLMAAIRTTNCLLSTK